MKRAYRRDSNEKEIIIQLRKIGATVAQINAPGVADLLVGHHGITYLMEVKTPRGKLTPDQQAFISLWEGSKVHIVRTPEQALDVLGVL